MPSQPETINDTVIYQLRNFHGDKDITVRMLDGSILDIWGPVFVNGNALTLIGALPIASNAEALAGTDNTKVMTPLRVREAGDARYALLGVGGGLTQEQIEDIVAALFAAGTHTNVTVTYNDSTPSISLVASGSGGLTQEQVEDAVAALFAAGTHTNVTVTYNDTTPSLSLVASGGGGLPPDGTYSDIQVTGSGTLWDLVTNSVTSSIIQNGAVSNAKLGPTTQYTMKGRITASTGAPTDLIPSEIRTVITSDSGGGTTNFLRADGTFAAPAGGGASISDTAYGTGWNGDTTNGASKNAIFDAIGDTEGISVVDYMTLLWADAVQLAGPQTITGAKTFSADPIIPDEAYGSGWNGVLEPPTKNAVYDKVETVVDLKVDKAQTINAQTGTTYTLVLTDDSKLVTLSNASAITLTVPTNTSVAYPTGTHIDLAQLGAGQVTVAGAGGVTVNATPTLKFRAQFSGASLVKYATDTWLLVGDLASS